MKTQILFLTLVAATLLGSCTKEIAPDSEGIASPSEFVSVTLPLQLAATDATPPSAMSQSSAAGNPSEGFSVSLTEATATDAPSTRTISRELTNVWVLQFDSTGNNVSATNTGTLAPEALLTAPSLQVGTGCTIYVVANGIASEFSIWYPSTLTEFESTMMYRDAITNTDVAKFPISGKLTNVTVESLGGGNGKIRVPGFGPPTIVLNRIHAEVTLTVDFDVTGYTLAGAELYYVAYGSTYGWNTATTTFPDNAKFWNFGYTNLELPGLTPVSTSTYGTKTTYKWFIGDNRRGEVADLNTPSDRNKYKAPAYATFARITTLSNAMYLYYDIYLGSGEVTNFEVKRNMTYTQTATIKGTAAFHEALLGTDARVSSNPHEISEISLTDNRADSPLLISPKSMESTSMMTWGLTAALPGARDIFNGKANTDAIMGVSATYYPAAKHCRDIGAEYYLPSQAELMLMWIYLPAIPVADRPASGDFWSSTVDSNYASDAWYVNFSNGNTNNSGTGRTYYVRCVREL